MKKYSILFVLAIVGLIASAQQDPQFSQNMFNNLAINPGYTGSNDAICATALHRSQWMGFEGAPTTMNLGVEGSVPMLHGGLGLNIVTDKIASNEFLGLGLSYAYRTSVVGGDLGIGASLGFLQDGVEGSQYNPESGGDPVIPGSDEKGAGFDLGLGLYFKSDAVELGISSTHLNQAQIATSQDILSLKRHYYLTALYKYQLNDMMLLKPSIFVKNDGATTQMDLNALMEYNNRFWGGVSYRMDDAFVALLGMHINESLKFGFAYDVPVSQIAHGGMEFMLGYSFKVDYTSVTKGFKNPKF